MANRKFWLGMPVIVLVFGFAVVGCTTTDLKSNLAGEYNLIPKIAGKDFEVLGLVSAQTSETVVVTPFRIQTTISGERVTFDLLLQEAKNLYPGVSDIINVRIDKVDKGTTGPFVWLTGYSATVEYFGNALAIRYTAALDEVRDPLSGKSGSLPSGGAGSGFDGVVEKLGKITGLFKK